MPIIFSTGVKKIGLGLLWWQTTINIPLLLLLHIPVSRKLSLWIPSSIETREREGEWKWGPMWWMRTPKGSPQHFSSVRQFVRGGYHFSIKSDYEIKTNGYYKMYKLQGFRVKEGQSCVFPRAATARKSMQLSPSLTRKPCTSITMAIGKRVWWT